MDCDDGIVCTTDGCQDGTCTRTPNGICGISGVVRYYRNHTSGGFEPSLKPVSGEDIDLDEDSVADATTDAGGNYGVGNLAGRIVVETLDKLGDHDGISSYDASAIARHVVQDITLSDNQQIAADVSLIPGISSFDASLVAQYAASLISQFPVSETITGSDWVFLRCDNYVDESNHDCTAPVYVYDPITASANDDFYAILYGEVTGNWTPPGASPVAETGESPVSSIDEQQVEDLSARALDPEILSWLQPGANHSPSDAAELELTGWRAPDGKSRQRRELVLAIREADGIQALDLQILFDPTAIRIVDARTVDLGSGFNLLTNDLGGDYRVAMYGVLPMLGSGAVLAITMDVEPGIGTEVPFEIRAEANEMPIPVRINGWGSPGSDPEGSRRAR
jgi:hypothetical protein